MAFLRELLHGKRLDAQPLKPDAAEDIRRAFHRGNIACLIGDPTKTLELINSVDDPNTPTTIIPVNWQEVTDYSSAFWGQIKSSHGRLVLTYSGKTPKPEAQKALFRILRAWYEHDAPHPILPILVISADFYRDEYDHIPTDSNDRQRVVTFDLIDPSLG